MTEVIERVDDSLSRNISQSGTRIAPLMNRAKPKAKCNLHDSGRWPRILLCWGVYHPLENIHLEDLAGRNGLSAVKCLLRVLRIVFHTPLNDRKKALHEVFDNTSPSSHDGRYDTVEDSLSCQIINGMEMTHGASRVCVRRNTSLVETTSSGYSRRAFRYSEPLAACGQHC